MHFPGKWIAAAAAVVLTGATWAPPAAGTLDVSISGAGNVRPNVVCSWEATVTGGTGAYTLSWSGGINGATQNDKYFATTPASGTFYITVTATDANGETDTSTKAVRVVSTAGPCLS